MKLPELRMASYLTFEALPAEIRDGLVPVRVERMEPVVTLSYEPIPCEVLMPEEWHYGEWPHSSPAYWQMLEDLGVERVTAELRAIGRRSFADPSEAGLVLLDHDSPGPAGAGGHGDRSLRVVLAAWLEEKTGAEVPELLADGTALHFSELPRRTKPRAPKDWRLDRRWRDAPDIPWPPTQEDVLRWIGAVHWQTARSPHNPHQYSVRHWSPELPFLRVVQHIREHGLTEEWGGDTYRYKRIGGFKYWTMGDPLPATIILNRKPWGQDPGDRDPAEEKTGRAPAKTESPAGVAPAGEAPQLFEAKLGGRPAALAEHINAEHRAASLAAGSVLRHALRCGELLCRAKEKTRYGQWLGWLADNTDLAPRTAQAYMRLFRETTERAQNTQRIDAHLDGELERKETA